VGAQEVRWEKGGTEWAENYTFFLQEAKEDHQLGTGFFLHQRIISAVMGAEFRIFAFLDFIHSQVFIRLLIA
jgi:mRNA-degrading endonuclease HigB of HigAB toxin-antitoxin module